MLVMCGTRLGMLVYFACVLGARCGGHISPTGIHPTPIVVGQTLEIELKGDSSRTEQGSDGLNAFVAGNLGICVPSGVWLE